MKKIIISILGLSVIGLAQANEKNGDLKSSATMQATCSISANQIGFGAVATPLLAQSAQSEMTVKCSNTSAYTIDLAYGGIYGSGSGSSGGSNGYTVTFNKDGGTFTRYSIYDSGASFRGYLQCGYSGQQAGKVYFGTTIVANLYGATADGWYPNNGACTSSNIASGAYPKGWSGTYDAAGSQPVGGGSAYAYGVMNGVSKGDKLAYSIALPSDANKVWNKGNNAYSSTGNGDNQTIALNAKIVPDKSSSKYLAPDMYLDTVTAVISY